MSFVNNTRCSGKIAFLAGFIFFMVQACLISSPVFAGPSSFSGIFQVEGEGPASFVEDQETDAGEREASQKKDHDIFQEEMATDFNSKPVENPLKPELIIENKDEFDWLQEENDNEPGVAQDEVPVFEPLPDDRPVFDRASENPRVAEPYEEKKTQGTLDQDESDQEWSSEKDAFEPTTVHQDIGPFQEKDVFIRGAEEKVFVEEPIPEEDTPSESAQSDIYIESDPIEAGERVQSFARKEYKYPYQLLDFYWQKVLVALNDDSLPALHALLNKFYEAKLDAGFYNAPVYAALLVRQGYLLLEKDDYAKARLLGETAHNLAPDFSPAALFLAHLKKSENKEGEDKLLHLNGNYWKSWFFYFPRQFRFVGRIIIIALMSFYVIFLLQGIYFALRYWRLLIHYLQERVPQGPRGTVLTICLFFLGLLAIILLASPFWMATALGFLFGKFARKWEKICFLIFLLIWALSPVIFAAAVNFIAPLPDAAKVIFACIQGNWDVSSDQTLERALEKYPDSYDLLLTKALVQKRKGEYQQAIDTLSRALERHPGKGTLYNNLGNLYAVKGATDKARDAYNKALELTPGLAAPHYNLSQLLRGEFSFLKGGKEFNSARKINSKKVDYYAYIQSSHPNRAYMDEEPSMFSLWHYAFSLEQGKGLAAKNLWSFAANGLPLSFTPFIFIFFAGVYGFYNIYKGSGGSEAFRCSSCGCILCSRCHSAPEVGGVCSACYQALYQKDNIPKDNRHRQFRQMAIYHSKRLRIIVFLNILFPGLGYSLVEEKPKGLLLYFIFLFFLITVLSWNLFVPSSMIVWANSGSFLWMVFCGLVIILYLFIQKRFLKKVRARR